MFENINGKGGISKVNVKQHSTALIKYWCCKCGLVKKYIKYPYHVKSSQVAFNKNK